PPARGDLPRWRGSRMRLPDFSSGTAPGDQWPSRGHQARAWRPTMKLQGKVALITGAGSGIGWATALLFAREGARVACADINEGAAKETAQQIEKAGGQARPIGADVARAADCQAMVERTVATWGRVDILFNNAGVPQAPTPVENLDEATFGKVMPITVRGVSLGCWRAV